MNEAHRHEHAVAPTQSRFVALRVAMDAMALVRPIAEAVRKRDRELEDQLRRAAHSVVLNLGEGGRSTAGNRRQRFETADGSLSELRVSLSLAASWGYVDAKHVAAADAQLDRVAAMLWRLRH